MFFFLLSQGPSSGPTNKIDERPREEDYDRDRVIQVHQNLNLSRTAELTNASAKYLKQLVIIGWVMVALLLLILISGAS